MATTSTAPGPFTATLTKWVSATKGVPMMVWRESTQRLVNEMQRPISAGGRMPVLTGFLRSSIQASTSPFTLTLTKGSGKSYSYDPAKITMAIAGVKEGGTLYIAYGAVYAAAQEFGGNGRAPKAFVRSAAMKWPAIVAKVCTEAKARYDGK